MDKPTRALLIGLVVGGLVFAVGAVISGRLARRVEEFRATCEAQRAKPGDEFAQYLLCDPRQLAASQSADPPGVQGDLARAERQRAQWNPSTFPFIAFFVAVLGGVPWAWYFLLQRIRELRGAIVGK